MKMVLEVDLSFLADREQLRDLVDHFEKKSQEYRLEIETSVNDLELTTRTANMLKHHGITTLHQLKNMQWWMVKGIPGIGKRSLNEIKDLLENY